MQAPKITIALMCLCLVSLTSLKLPTTIIAGSTLVSRTMVLDLPLRNDQLGYLSKEQRFNRYLFEGNQGKSVIA